ncbi:MAG: class I SAM-dependent methyltransferase [Phycisphaerales bacterium]
MTRRAVGRRTNRSITPAATDVAASVDLPRSLLPFLPRIFAGMESLGSSPRTIVPLLIEHAPARSTPRPRKRGSRNSLTLRVLDLACGKGDLAISIARRLNRPARPNPACRVLAIDACDDFITHARARAARLGVEHLCEFRAARINSSTRLGRGVLAGEPAFDVAMMIGLWGVERAAPLLSRLVRPGGVYVIDDAFAVDARAVRRFGAATLAEALQHIRAQGDAVLHASLVPLRSVRASSARILARLTRNTRDLAREHPRLRPALAEFIRRQRAASRLLERGLRPGLIVARRA